MKLLLLLALFFHACAATINVTVNSDFNYSDVFAFGEFSATLEACAGASPLSQKHKTLQLRCLKTLVSPDVTCFEVSGEDSGPLLCDLDGSPFTSENVFLDCEGACPLQNATLSQTLSQQQNCTRRKVNGYDPSCYSSAFCQFFSEGAGFGGSFGDYCPDGASGEFCCGSDVEKDVFEGAMLSAPSSVDYLRDVSHITDLSFKLYYDTAPPGLLQITVEVPYVTSESKIVFVKSGNAVEYSMCPTTYMIDFQDPVEALPRKESHYFRRTDVGKSWLPLTFFPVSDLVGRPRSACGNFDFSYTSENAFRHAFTFPDIDNSTSRLTYSAPPKTNGTEFLDAPEAGDSFWKMSAPSQARVNYTTMSAQGSFYDILKTFHECKNYETGERLIRKKVEQEMAYLGGVPYGIETYEFSLHVCQVGFFGSGCDNPLTPKMYAKTCALIPASFSVAPQQISHVSTTPTSSSIVSKTFLQSVEGVQSNCSPGHERIAITLNFLVFELDYELFPDAVHDVITPKNMFDAPAVDFAFKEVPGNVTTVYDFLRSAPPEEGVYKMRRVDSVSGFDESYYQKIIILTKCYYTGFNAATGERTAPANFADSVKTEEGKIALELEFILKRMNTPHDLRNTLHIQIIATAETFALASVTSISQDKQVDTVHTVYNSYEAAKADTTESYSGGVTQEGHIVFEGDQLCSKHSVAGDQSRGALLHPNAVGACVLTEAGETFADGGGERMFGKSVMYRAAGMTDAATYVFGCEPDWIDVSDLFPSPEGIYFFGGSLKRTIVKTHEKGFWFVTKGELNRELLGDTTETLSDRFASGVFHYDTDEKRDSSDVSQKLQLDSMTALLQRDRLPAGCAEIAGFLRGACNLVCFDVAAGLLTPTDRQNGTLLVHHTSVATLASSDEIGSPHAFSRRRLLDADVTRRDKIRSIRVGKRWASEDHHHHDYHDHNDHHDGYYGNADRGDIVLFISFLLILPICCFLWPNSAFPQRFKKNRKVYYMPVIAQENFKITR